MAENGPLAGRERPPDEGIQSWPRPVRAARPLDLLDKITRHPESAELSSQQEQRERAGPPGGQPLGSEATEETSRLGCASLILGAVAICSIGVGFLLFFAGMQSRTVAMLYGWALALPGMALGVACFARRGRSNSAGVAGCCINGLILGVWLLLLAVIYVAERWQPQDSNPTFEPYDKTPYFSR